MCVFCDEINLHQGKSNNSIYNMYVSENESVIWKNDEITLLSDILPLSKCHLLLVPNRHILSISHMTIAERDSLFKLCDRIIEENKKLGLNTLMFEHGTGSVYKDFTGASITHAHLHIIGTKDTFSVRELLPEDLEKDSIKRDSLFVEYKENKYNYIFVEECDRSCFIINRAKIPSQYLRKIIGESCHNNCWDWRENINNDFIENIKLYKDLLGGTEL